MNDQPAVLTDDTFHVVDSERFVADSEAWTALLGWCRFHGIDPGKVPWDAPIIRDGPKCRILYVEYDRSRAENGWIPRSHCTLQGETPPLPWPPQLERYRV